MAAPVELEAQGPSAPRTRRRAGHPVPGHRRVLRSPAAAGDLAGAATSPAGDPLAALADVTAELATLAQTDWHGLPGQAVHDALDLLEQSARRLEAARAAVLTAAEANGLWALHGSRTFAGWLRTRTGSTAAAASRQVREARALRDHLPVTREALAAGCLGAQHAAVLVRETTRTALLRSQLADPEVGERFLVEQAQEMDAGTFTSLVQAWAVAADPEGADRAWREADGKEELTLSPTTGGWQVRGWLDDVSGQVVSTALGAHAGRKGAEDERTPAQRRAAALVSLAHRSLDDGEVRTSARIRPHLTVTVSLELLRALAAATGSAVPAHAPDEPTGLLGLPAQLALSAPGGPQDPARPQAPGPVAAGGPVEVGPEASSWVERWRTGDRHVISTALDPASLRGLAPATLEDGTPVAPALLARLACESQLSRVVFGPESTVLDAGREKRIFPANQVRAIIARDRHCQWPGCDEPPGFGEVHHSLWWALHGGRTDVEHGVLLCWHHHDWTHAHQVTITRSSGRWWFHDRNGRPVTTPGPGP